MTKDQLQCIGISEEIAEKVIAIHEESIKNNFVPMSRFNEVNEAKKNAEAKMHKELNEYSILTRTLDIKGVLGDIIVNFREYGITFICYL